MNANHFIMNAKPGTSDQKWIDQFHEELSQEEGDPTIDDHLSKVLKDYLLSNGAVSAMEAANQVNRCFHDDWLTEFPSQPLAFMSVFYDMALILAKLFPHDDAKQVSLTDLLRELGEPQMDQLKVGHEDYLLWRREPVLDARIDEMWNHDYPRFSKLKDGDESLQEQCNRWINFSSFVARVLEAGLLDNSTCRRKYASWGCHDGLEVDLPQQQRRNCEVMVAVQYILLSGHALAEDYANAPAFEGAMESWKRWAEKLQQISREDECGQLAHRAKEAYGHMRSLTSEVLSTCDDKQTEVAAPAEETKETGDQVASVASEIGSLQISVSEPVQGEGVARAQEKLKWWKRGLDMFRSSG